MDVRLARPANSRQVPDRHSAPAATQVELVPLLTDTMQEVYMKILVMIVEIIQLHRSSRQEVMRVFVILGIPRHQMHAISVRQIVIVQTRHLQNRVLPMPIRLLRRLKNYIASATRGTTGSQMLM